LRSNPGGGCPLGQHPILNFILKLKKGGQKEKYSKIKNKKGWCDLKAQLKGPGPARLIKKDSFGATLAF